jgi:5-methylcytosine-specific restriction endonuclease McrA
MPIKPENRTKYPPDWEDIRERILARAGNSCERCGVRNGYIYRRLVDYPQAAILEKYSHYFCGATLGEPVKIVLTIAHLDRALVDHSDENLEALCQRCHNLLDAPSRAANAAITRASKRKQKDLFADRQE